MNYVVACSMVFFLAVLSAHGVTDSIRIGGASDKDFQWYEGVVNSNTTPYEYNYVYDVSKRYPALVGLTITVTALETNNVFITDKGVYTGGTNGVADRLDGDECIVLSVSYSDPFNLLKELRVEAFGAYYCGDGETMVYTVGNTSTNVSAVANGAEFDYNSTGLTPLTIDAVDTWEMRVTVADANTTGALGLFEIEYVAGDDDLEITNPIRFSFDDGGVLDGAGIGGSLTRSNIVLTTVDIIGQDGSLASEGAGHLTWSDSQNSLGIHDAVNSLGITSSEARDFNPGEGWVFSFDTDVTIDEIDFAGWTAPSEMTLSSSEFDDFLMEGDVADDTYYPRVDVSAGTEITLQMTLLNSSTNTDKSVRLKYIDVTLGGQDLSYLAWAYEQGITNNNYAFSADPDGDSMNNLMEYALGGDPLLDDAADVLPKYGVNPDGNDQYFDYIYRRRIDYAARGLTYTVGSTWSLEFEQLTNATVEVGSGIIDAEFEEVTNRISMDVETKQFMQLQISLEED